MNSKRITAQHRLFKLDLWLRRQPLDGQFNRILESAAVFRTLLIQWAESEDPSQIAPSFQYTCI
jgi:hypothetical protein